MSSPVFLQLREVECWKCGGARLSDGTRHTCGAYENRNIQLRDGRWRDVRYPDGPATLVSKGQREAVDHSAILEAFLDMEADRLGRVQ